MSDDIGDWYASKAEEARVLAIDLKALREARDLRKRRGHDVRVLDREIEKLERRLEQARYVGD